MAQQTQTHFLKYNQLSPIDNKIWSDIKSVEIYSDELGTEIIIFTKNDEIYFFGNNSNGRMGMINGTKTDNTMKITDLSGKKITKVEFSEHFMAALSESGDIYSTGYNISVIHRQNSFRNILVQNRSTLPKLHKMNLNLTAYDIKCCSSTLFVLTKTNIIYTIKYNQDQLIQNLTQINMNCFYNEKIAKITTGANHILAMSCANKIYAWNVRDNMEVGVGTVNDYLSNNPLQIQVANISFKDISCGYNHSLLLTSNGLIYSLGYNAFGQLGTGTTSAEFKPKPISCQKNFVEIFGVQNMSLALSKNNTIYIWGQTKSKPILFPVRTNAKSFQEAIDTYCQNIVTYKPLTPKDILIENPKPLNRVIETMSKAFNNPKNSDLKFRVKRKGNENYDYIYGHKWFIEENSEHFQTMFANDWKENKSNEIQINGYTYEAYYQYIRSLYTDYIETKDIEILIELLSITDEYLDEDMKLKCVEKIKPLITAKNVCTLYSCSLKYRSNELESYSFQIMSDNIKSISTSGDFEKMDSIYAKHFSNKYFQLK